MATEEELDRIIGDAYQPWSTGPTAPRLVNLCPHPITLFDVDGKSHTFPSEGNVRLVEDNPPTEVEPIGGMRFQVRRRPYQYTDIQVVLQQNVTLKPGDSVVMSMLSAQAIRRRAFDVEDDVLPQQDIYAIDTGAGAVRNEKNMIVGSKALILYRPLIVDVVSA